jgi:glutamate 5-kinase
MAGKSATFTRPKIQSALKKVLVIKLGTAAITTADGLVNTTLLRNICEQVAALHKDHQVLMVSSGAVGSGKPFIQGYKASINQKKAAAAIGNPLLMAQYARHFAKNNITVAQCLLERNHFIQRERFVQLKATITELWKSQVIPICNDNDVVNDLELRFSDNDELATLLAVAFNARKLLIGSSVAGLINKAGTLVPQVQHVDESVFDLVRPEKTAQGLGGMFSKLSHTKMATAMGIETVIFSAREKGNILRAYHNQTGTTFTAQKSTLNARQRWLVSGRTHSSVVVDAGAAEALRKRKSLLAVGVKTVNGLFLAGEMIEIETESGEIVAMARSKVSAREIETATGSLVVAHANDIMLT